MEAALGYIYSPLLYDLQVALGEILRKPQEMCLLAYVKYLYGLNTTIRI